MYAFALTLFLPFRVYVLYGYSQKELHSKNLKKIIHFPILKETKATIYWPIGVFNSLGVVTMHIHMFKIQQFTKMIWLNLFLFSMQGSNVKSEKESDIKKYFLFCAAFLTVKVK